MGSKRTDFKTRFVITLLLVGIVSYFWGALTVHKQMFPYPQILLLKYEHFDGSSRRQAILQKFNSRPEVVMVGDSLTADAPWNAIFPNVQIANRGVGADTTNKILLRMNAIVFGSPKKALIMAGINDFYHGASADSVFQNYREIVVGLQHAGVTVIIQSTLECRKEVCGYRVYQVRDLNKQLEEFAKETNIVFLDINADLSSPSDGLLSTYSYDGIHLLASGYVKWGEAIRPYVTAN
jgi:lysophospholipase L1-like esterase